MSSSSATALDMPTPNDVAKTNPQIRYFEFFPVNILGSLLIAVFPASGFLVAIQILGPSSSRKKSPEATIFEIRLPIGLAADGRHYAGKKIKGSALGTVRARDSRVQLKCSASKNVCNA
jgi:hypothetical protein